ncbi:MAG TPA: TetR/AcrR family transcriptional regulator [Actinomycetota bacterium]|nr:TetR/AcrR family transcriptional regulator [Actinomycetota bacterium]
MSTRAAAAEATRERIIDAACEAFNNRWYGEVTLRGIAEAAGVALQTVVNHFSSKEALYVAVSERNVQNTERTRFSPTPGDVPAAVTVLVDDYERNGDAIVRMLAVEEQVPVVRPFIAVGRQRHEAWVEQMFPGALGGLDGEPRRRRRAQLVVVTDVYTWKLLRRDKGLDRNETITAMCELVLALHNKEGGS